MVCATSLICILVSAAGYSLASIFSAYYYHHYHHYYFQPLDILSQAFSMLMLTMMVLSMLGNGLIILANCR